MLFVFLQQPTVEVDSSEVVLSQELELLASHQSQTVTQITLTTVPTVNVSAILQTVQVEADSLEMAQQPAPMLPAFQTLPTVTSLEDSLEMVLKQEQMLVVLQILSTVSQVTSTTV